MAISSHPVILTQVGAYLIDHSPTYFEPVLNYSRNGRLIFDQNLNPEGVLEEAKFFGIESILPALEQAIADRKNEQNDFPQGEILLMPLLCALQILNSDFRY